MGGKSARAGKFFYLCAAFVILAALAGCLSSQRTITSRAEILGAKKAQPESSPGTSVDHLSRARTLMVRGDYDGARREDQKALTQAGRNPPADEALFHLGLIHAHPGNPGKNLPKSLSVLKKLVQGYPDSPWAEEAKILVAILEENERLQTLIQQSKKVDVEIEEKKRERGGK